MLYPTNPSDSSQFAFLKRAANIQDRGLRRQARDHEATVKLLVNTIKVTSEQISRLEAQLKQRGGELAPTGSASVGFQAFWVGNIYSLLEQLEGIVATYAQNLAEEQAIWEEQRARGEEVLEDLKKQIEELEESVGTTF